jgi:hypothetical protein
VNHQREPIATRGGNKRRENRLRLVLGLHHGLKELAVYIWIVGEFALIRAKSHRVNSLLYIGESPKVIRKKERIETSFPFFSKNRVRGISLGNGTLEALVGTRRSLEAHLEPFKIARKIPVERGSRVARSVVRSLNNLSQPSQVRQSTPNPQMPKGVWHLSSNRDLSSRSNRRENSSFRSSSCRTRRGLLTSWSGDCRSC